MRSCFRSFIALGAMILKAKESRSEIAPKTIAAPNTSPTKIAANRPSKCGLMRAHHPQEYIPKDRIGSSATDRQGDHMPAIQTDKIIVDPEIVTAQHDSRQWR